MAQEYTTQAAIQNYLLISIDSSFSSQITEWIEAVSEYISRATGRVFVADTTATARVFNGSGSNQLLIDDCVELTSIVVDGETLSTSDYVLEHANNTPKYKVILKNGAFCKGLQNVTVTAKWGYSVSVPPDIKMVATILVAGIINYSNKGAGAVQSETIGRYNVTYSSKEQWNDYQSVDTILAGYKDYNF